jgi:SAM-dependent methyltransferase
MVLLARPHARIVAVDLFKEGYGIAGNEPDRLRANVRAVGAEDRLEVKNGDLRKLPFEPGSFDAAVSSFVVDHLGKAGSQQAIGEVARVLRPGGQFLLMVLNTDAYVKFAYPLINVHMYYGHGGSADRWRSALTGAGFEVVEQGTQPATMYFLAEKRR